MDAELVCSMPPLPVAHHQKRVVPVGDLADEPRGRLHDALQVGQHLFAIHRGSHVLERDPVRYASHREAQCLLVAHEDRAVVQDVEIGRGKRVRAAGGIEPRRDSRPAGRQLDGDGDGVLEPPRHVQKEPRRRDVGPVLAQEILCRERDCAVDIVAHQDHGRISGRHPPRVLRDLLPGQRTPGAILGAEVRNVLRVVADAVVARRPDRHFEVLDLALQALRAERDVEDVVGRLRHRDRECHRAFGRLAGTVKGRGGQRGPNQEDAA